MSTHTLTTKEAKNVQEVLDIVAEAAKDGLTKRAAFNALVTAKNILRHWDTDKPADEQECRLEYQSVQSALTLWWRYCRKGKAFSAEVLWDICILLDGLEDHEDKGAVKPELATKKKASKKAAKKPVAKKEKPAVPVTPAMQRALDLMEAK